MKPQYQIMMLILTACLGFACASSSAIKVTYHLPRPSDALKGKAVSVSFEDLRENKRFLGDSAKAEFPYFTGNLYLYESKPGRGSSKVGLFNMDSLFLEVFQMRLASMGVTTLTHDEKGKPELVIGLREMLLDLKDRKWVVSMNYEVRLLKDGKYLAKQMVEGRAERVKIIGQDAAETVIDELFSDMIHRVDLVKLFQQAGL